MKKLVCMVLALVLCGSIVLSVAESTLDLQSYGLDNPLEPLTIYTYKNQKSLVSAGEE